VLEIIRHRPWKGPGRKPLIPRYEYYRRHLRRLGRRLTSSSITRTIVCASMISSRITSRARTFRWLELPMVRNNERSVGSLVF
jgi:hypothetical protein